MSPIGHLLDGTGQLYRPSETRDATFRTKDKGLVILGSPVALTVQISRESVAPRSAGERVIGTYRVYMDAGEDVQQRDVLVILTGPNSGLRLEVDHKYAPRGHHLQLVCVEFDGAVP